MICCKRCFYACLDWVFIAFTRFWPPAVVLSASWEWINWNTLFSSSLLFRCVLIKGTCLLTNMASTTNLARKNYIARLTVGRAWPGLGQWSQDGVHGCKGLFCSAVPRLPHYLRCYCWDWTVPSGGWRTHRLAVGIKKIIIIYLYV